MVINDIYICGGGAHGHGCFWALINAVERQKPCIYFAQRIPVQFVLLWGRRVSWGFVMQERSFGKCYIDICILENNIYNILKFYLTVKLLGWYDSLTWYYSFDGQAVTSSILTILIYLIKIKYKVMQTCTNKLYPDTSLNYLNYWVKIVFLTPHTHS